MDIYDIFNKDEFSALSKRQKELIIEACQKCKGKDQTGVVSVFMTYIPIIESERQLTKQEKRGLINCIFESIDGNEKSNAKNIIDIAQSMGII